MQPLSREELLAAHSSDEERQKILRLVTLSDILGYCIIARDYKPPTFLNDQIKLTPYGMEKVTGFARKRIPVPEARAICFLEFSWIDLLVDPMETNIKNVQGAISKLIKDRAIIYPFVYGRELYDKAYTEIDSDERTLDLADTLKFLDGTPQGVFQLHEYVTGPFGLLNSKQLRFCQPQREAYLMHCDDTNCHSIHKVYFSTATEAPINKHRMEALRVLQRDSEIPSAWGSFIGEIFKGVVHQARDNVSETLIPLLGDCLTDVEMKALTAWLLDNTQGSLREVCASLGIRGNASDIVTDMNRAQLMQLCLTMSDREIIQGIDTLVHEQAISVPPTEVRVPLINGNSNFGTFHMSAELGSRGVRIVSDNMNLAPLRLRDLIERMYRLTDVADREELEWQLRSAPGDTLEGRLENYLREQQPSAVIESLVLARKSNAVAACELLALREGAVESDDFISLVLWKLGFTSPSNGDPHVDFWRHHEDMERMARLGPGGPMSPSVEEFRSTAVNYFVSLENVLDDAISFVIWSLTHDHVTDRRPFIFEPERQRAESYRWLQKSVIRKGDTELDFGEKNTLYALCRGFQCIGSELQQIAAERESYQRASSDFPDWVNQQSLQRFPFSHIIPFLDLTDDSRESIIQNLQEISRMLVSQKVYDARNNWLHGGRKDLDFGNVRSALLAVRGAVQLLEDCGFVRITFANTGRQSDGLGRSVMVIKNPRGVSVEVHTPSPFAWLGLPSLYDEVHLMTAACFAAPNHFLRFRSESNSPYAEMWGDYPRRKPRSQRARNALEGVAGGLRDQGPAGEAGLSALS
ncbi:hypothetical protein ABZX95_28280 [Streptomyces sp. NPDC004232]|uniref:hypothetical protein n=1 Tax=Streptomyces sp. NPDC004232 TaxID=3154454 RepID=UPI001D597F68|nr:hypothetical protein [Streptomyces sp. tea 10]